jgi:hypothetical protein
MESNHESLTMKIILILVVLIMFAMLVQLIAMYDHT